MKHTAYVAPLFALACACTPSVKTVTVDPESETLEAKGAGATFRALLKDAKGQRISDPSLRPRWTSSAPLVATVDEAGRVTAQTSGDAVITAVVGGLKSEAKVKVAIPATVTLVPPTLELKTLGQRATLTANVTDAAGRPLAAKGLDWDSSNPAVARVAAGQVTAITAGKAVVTARLNVLKAEAAVTVAVAPPQAPSFHKLVVKPGTAKLKQGGTLKLTAAGLDRKGKPVGDVPAAWKSSNPAVASVEAGTVTAAKKGTVKITAAAGGKTATAKVTVTR